MQNTQLKESIRPIFYDKWGNEYYDPRFLDRNIIEVRVDRIVWNKVDENPNGEEWSFDEKRKLLKLGRVSEIKPIVYVE